MALRMWSYLLDESDEDFVFLMRGLHEHRERMRRVAIEKRAKKAYAAAVKAQEKGCEDPELMEAIHI